MPSIIKLEKKSFNDFVVYTCERNINDEDKTIIYIILINNN